MCLAKKFLTAWSHEQDARAKWKVQRGFLTNQAWILGCLCVGAGTDAIEEADEFLMPMALNVWADHRSIDDIEGGKQGCGSVACVIVELDRPAATFHGPTGLCEIELLDLVLFIDREHDGMGRLGKMETDKIVVPFDECLVIGRLETAPAVRSQTVIVPELYNCRSSYVGFLGHGALLPVPAA